MSLSQKIIKYYPHYLIVIPALFIILILKVIPALNGLKLSFSHYNIFSGSSWDGVVNYKALFQDASFKHAMIYTFLYKSAYLVLTGFIAFGAALALSKIKSATWRSWITTGLLVPYVLPSVLVGFGVLVLFGPVASVDSDATATRFVLLLTEAIKTCGIPIIVALAAIASKHASAELQLNREALGFWRMSGLPALRAIAALSLIQLAVMGTTDLELVYSLLNTTSIGESWRTVDYYIFRNGLMFIQVGLASAAWVIQLLIQFGLAAAAYFIVRGKFIQDLFRPSEAAAQQLSRHSGISGILVGAVSVILILGVLFYVFIYPFLHAKGSYPIGAEIPELSPVHMALFICIYGAAIWLNMLMTVTLAYPLTVRRLPGGLLYRLFLIAVMCLGTGSFHEFGIFSQLGLTNTLFPHFLLGVTNIVGVFIIKSIFNSKYGHLKAQAEQEGKGEFITFFTLFIPKIWKPLLALSALHFITLWNSIIPSIIYSFNPLYSSPMARFYGLINLDAGELNPAVMQTGAILSLIPLALLILFRKWLTSEVLLSGMLKK
ncbi:hypothetical protein [Paenibacillus paeoniae]|nr:hypothetical protein [Paenibacillus paeoniae]